MVPDPKEGVLRQAGLWATVRGRGRPSWSASADWDGEDAEARDVEEEPAAAAACGVCDTGSGVKKPEPGKTTESYDQRRESALCASPYRHKRAEGWRVL